MNATEYLKLWKQHKTWKRLALPVHQRRFKRCASLVKGSTFIDVGCALGHSTHYLSQYKDGCWAGLEFDCEAALEAKRLFPKHDFFFSPTYEMFAITRFKFDSVVCSEVIEHVEEDGLFLKELLKLAKSRVVLTTPARPIVSKGHLRCYTKETLASLLSGLNFKIKREGWFFYVTIDINKTIN